MKKRNVIYKIFNNPIIYILIGLLSLAGVFLIFSNGINSYNNSLIPKEKDSDFLEISAKNSPGMIWAEHFIKLSINDEKMEGSDSNKPKHIISENYCANINSALLTENLLSTYSSSNNSIELKAQIFGAGQAYKEFLNYKKILDNCSKTSEILISNKVSYFNFSNGSILSAGDTIIGLIYPIENPKILSFYLEKLSNTLIESKCINLSETLEDSKRSFYYDNESYTGLTESEVLNSKIEINNLPNPIKPNILEITEEETYRPENPLPDKFPELPEEVIFPELIPEIPNQEIFSSTAKWQVKDPVGPGCGWNWSSFKEVVLDETELKNLKNESLIISQNTADSLSKTYLESKTNWAYSSLNTLVQINNWNSYVLKTNNVYSKWNWLNNERINFKPIWDTYISQYNYWSNFDNEKSTALDSYNNEVTLCNDEKEKLKEWEAKYGDNNTNNPTVSPTPTPSFTPEEPTVSIPSKPSGCLIEPIRPIILDESKPAKPEVPTPPEGVTVPDSWIKPV